MLRIYGFQIFSPERWTKRLHFPSFYIMIFLNSFDYYKYLMREIVGQSNGTIIKAHMYVRYSYIKIVISEV